MNSPFSFIKSLRATALLATLIAAFTVTALPQAGTSFTEAIDANSIVIPMDNQRQGNDGCAGPAFNIRAYGLAVHLLHAGVPLKWIISDAKAKDGVDVTFNVTQLRGNVTRPDPLSNVNVGGQNCGTNGGGSNIAFRGGPLVIPVEYRDTALGIIATFNNGTDDNNDVRIFNITNSTVAPVRYTLTQKPKVAYGPGASGGTGFGTTIFRDLMAAAGMTVNTHYLAVSDSAFQPGQCVTMAAQEHAADNLALSYFTNYKNFTESGGNLMLQCNSIKVFENDRDARFQTNNDWKIYGTNSNSSGVVTNDITQFDNPSMPYSQIVGNLEGNVQGYVSEYELASGATLTNIWGNTTAIVARNGSAANNTANDRKYVASVSKIGTAPAGGQVFELGGHQYGVDGTGITEVNGRRMFLNAMLVPAYREGCGLSINSMQAFKTVSLINDPGNDGVPNYGSIAEWKIRYINDGNVDITNFQVNDSINGLNTPATKLIYAGALVAKKYTSIAAGNTATTLTVNPNFNGGSDTVVLASTVTVKPGEMVEITFQTTINGFGLILNQAKGSSDSFTSLLTDTADNTTAGTVASRDIKCASGCVSQVGRQTSSSTDPTGFDLGAVPTAGDATVGGQLLEANGRGIAREIVTLQNAATGDVKVTTSNTFGRFSFSEIDTGEFYILSVKSRKYIFQPNQMSFQLVDSLTDLVFRVGEPPVTRGGNSTTKGSSPVVTETKAAPVTTKSKATSRIVRVVTPKDETDDEDTKATSKGLR